MLHMYICMYVYVLPQIREAFAKHRTQLVLSLLGLKRCADTIVGNEKVRPCGCASLSAYHHQAD